jgi:hypothetical protein
MPRLILLLCAVPPNDEDRCLEKMFGKVGGTLWQFDKKLLAEASN